MFLVYILLLSSSRSFKILNSENVSFPHDQSNVKSPFSNFFRFMLLFGQEFRFHAWGNRQCMEKLSVSVNEMGGLWPSSCGFVEMLIMIFWGCGQTPRYFNSPKTRSL